MTVGPDDLCPERHLRLLPHASISVPGLARFRRIDPDGVPDDLLARVLRRLFGIEPHQWEDE